MFKILFELIITALATIGLIMVAKAMGAEDILKPLGWACLVAGFIGLVLATSKK